MSIPRRMTVTCTKCGKQIDATVFQSVNSDFAQDIAVKITSGKLFDVKCGSCEQVMHLEYDILYHDIKHEAMVWVIHKTTPEYQAKIAEIRDTKALPYKTLRIVSNMNELKEKVSCLEHGRDDRIIELCKVYATYNLLAQQQDFDFKEAFYAVVEAKEQLFFYDNVGNERRCLLSDKVYNFIKELYLGSPRAKEFDANYAIVDCFWAEEMLQALLEDMKNKEDEVIQDGLINKQEEGREEKLFCHKCKNQLPQDSEYCQYCGCKVEKRKESLNATCVHIESERVVTRAEEHKATERFEKNVENTIVSNTSKEKSKKKGKMLIVVVILLLMCGIGFFIWINARHYCNYTKCNRQNISCTESGFRKYACDECGKSIHVHEEAGRHELLDGVCQICGYMTFGAWTEENMNSVESIPTVIPHEHVYLPIGEKPATCLEMGVVTSKCLCGETRKEMSKKLDHVLVNGTCKICETVVFESLVFKGNGPSSIKNIDLPEGEYYIIGKHYGNSNFIADFYRSISQSYGDLIANKIGKSETISAIRGPIKNGYIDVRMADGNWEFMIVACDTYDSKSLEKKQVYEGTGKKVITNINVPKGEYYITCFYEGSSNFTVYFYESVDDTYGKLIANKIGKSESVYGFTGQAKQGYIDIGMAEGAWKIIIEPCD